MRNNGTQLRVALGAMMFFQYAAWGAWAPVLGATLATHLGAKGSEIGGIFGILWLACIITPFVGGQLVDRLMPGQIFLGIAAIGCAISAWFMANAQDLGAFAPWMWVWSLLFASTIGIANSVVLYHLGKEYGSTPERVERDFSLIRTAGGVAWILVAFAVAWSKGTLQLPAVGVEGSGGGGTFPVSEMVISCVAAALWAITSLFFVPNTPPSKEKSDPLAFTKAFTLFNKPGFLAFIIISFLASTEFQFFYTLSGQFLLSLKVEEQWIGPAKAISQFAEIFAMALLLPIVLKKFGMRWTLVVGTLAWAVRYFIFALQDPLWLVLASLSLHGIGFAFVFVTSYFYIDRVAPRDIRASAQSLFTLITLGIGNYVGSIVSGQLQDRFTTRVAQPVTEAGGKIVEVATVNWPIVFLIPAIAVVISAIAFYLTFKEPARVVEEGDVDRAKLGASESVEARLETGV